MTKTNPKSDVKAKAAFVRHLEENGFTDVKVVKAPSDIMAVKDGEQWYFEIKMTKHKDRYFGAATFTEWEQAFKTPDTYRFVVAIEPESEDENFEFIELTPTQLMRYSSIPPCKVYFNLDIPKLKNGNDEAVVKPRQSKALKLTEKAFQVIYDAFRSLQSV